VLSLAGEVIGPLGWTKLVAITKGEDMRFPQLTLDQLNEQQKPLGDQIMTVSSLGIGGPYNLLLRSPVLGQRLYDLFYYLRWQTSVPTRLNERSSATSRSSTSPRSPATM
jgi:4-carboxymuconolactone decarboxylase